jgi:hypothetical protein
MCWNLRISVVGLRLITVKISCPYFQKCHISFMDE